MPDLDLVENLTQLSPPALLAVALYGLGFVLKKSPLPDWLIPFVLPCVGAVVFPFIADTSAIGYAVKSPTAWSAIAGFVLGTGSTWINEATKQFTNRKSEP